MKQLVFCLIVIVAFTGGSLALFYKRCIPKIGFVDNNKLYKDFKGKVELERKFIKEKEAEQAYLDSMYLQIKLVDEKLKSPSAGEAKLKQTLSDMKERFDKLAGDFNTRDKEMESKYLDQIWTQINQYSKEYGKKHGYDIILGAQGNGSLMYGTDGRDITAEVTDYCNKAYEGK